MKMRFFFLPIAFTICALGAAAFPFAAQAEASIAITEIMYDVVGTDTGREWIEVENTSSTDIDLSTWKLFEASTNHKVAAVGSPLIPAGGFAVIADVPDKFMADNPGFSGLVFDSAFSLGSDGETIVLRDPMLADIDAVSYLPAWGAAGDGNSLQKRSDGTWIANVPTPGGPTTATGSILPASDEPDDTASTSPAASPGTSTGGNANASSQATLAHSSQELANLSYERSDFEIASGRARLGFTGTPLSFRARLGAVKNIPAGSTLTDRWSFGDGTEALGEAVWHTYAYPGDYVVVLNSMYGSSPAVSRTNIKIVDPSVVVSAPYRGVVEISNGDAAEVNIGGFIIEDSRIRFIVPADTIISPGSSIRIVGTVTGIADPADYIRIANPSGAILSQVSISAVKTGPVPTIVLPEGFDADTIKARFEEYINQHNEK